MKKLEKFCRLELLGQLWHCLEKVSDEADVKTRIAQVSHYRIGLNSAGRAFAHVELRLMAEDAAFCSHQAWSVRISARFISTIFTHLGSVAIFKRKTPISL